MFNEKYQNLNTSNQNMFDSYITAKIEWASKEPDSEEHRIFNVSFRSRAS